MGVTFRTTLWSGDGRNAGIRVPEEVLAEVAPGTRVPVVVTVDGGYSFRSTMAVMGGRILISFNADTRAKTGKGVGDEVEITLEHDTAPRTVEAPPALREALDAHPDAAAAWERLAPSHRRAHADAIDGAKTDETRARRVAKALDALLGR